jgi:hypothetical protein
VSCTLLSILRDQSYHLSKEQVHVEAVQFITVAAAAAAAAAAQVVVAKAQVAMVVAVKVVMASAYCYYGHALFLLFYRVVLSF